MSLVPILGHFYLNKNMAQEFSNYLQPDQILKMASLSRKCRDVYQQDIIWWVHLYKSFPELRYLTLLIHLDASRSSCWTGPRR